MSLWQVSSHLQQENALESKHQIQEISIFPSSQLSISGTRIVFSPHSKGDEGTLQALNFWLERDQLDVKELRAQSDEEAE